jgi:uncharacterized protein with NRDE domain
VCTLAFYFRMLPDYPVLVAANRDEQYDRPSAAPAVLDSEPGIIAGKDLRAGGTWLGVNKHGVLAAMLNRRVNCQNVSFPDARSRGLLCMDFLLAHRSAAEAESFIRHHQGPYNPFTALVADQKDAHVSYNVGKNILTQALEPGLHVFSSAAEFDLRSAKADRAYSLFGRLGETLRQVGTHDLEATTVLRPALGDHSLPSASMDAGDAICVHRENSGTVSSSIVLLSSTESRFKFFHCAGAPCQTGFGAAIEIEVK